MTTNTLTLDDLFGATLVASLVVAMLAFVVFGRFSVARIEKSIMAEGKPRPCPWDGVGGRVVWYAWTVALPAAFFNEIDDRMLNTADVKRYVTRGDRIRAWCLMVAAHTMLTLVIAGWIFDVGAKPG